jgi:hypothetical protein
MSNSEFDEIERQFESMGLGTEWQRSHFRQWATCPDPDTYGAAYFQRVTNTDGGPADADA